MRNSTLLTDDLVRDSILRVGEVVAVHGRTVTVQVDQEKNLSHLLFDGMLIKNISVYSYIEIRKGFIGLIGRVEGEEIKEELRSFSQVSENRFNEMRRLLTVSLVGYIDKDNRFAGGTKELPLIGNEAFIMSADKIRTLHDLLDSSDLSVTIAETEDEIEIEFPIDGLFNGHIAIFGNTGSGKSNTLTYLYQELLLTLRHRNPRRFKENSKYLLFDFNGEYGKENEDAIITAEKTVYMVSNEETTDRPIPISETYFLDLDVLSILTDATEKTQKPFLSRVLELHSKAQHADCTRKYLRKIVQEQTKRILSSSDKHKALQLLDYMEIVLSEGWRDSDAPNLRNDLEWFGGSNPGFRFKLDASTNEWEYANGNPESEHILETLIFNACKEYAPPSSVFDRIIAIAYIRLIDDVYFGRFQNDHVAPVLGRLIKRKSDLAKIFIFSADDLHLWSQRNFVVVNLNYANLQQKKTVPLLVAKFAYEFHKSRAEYETLNIIVDEAHQILSYQSHREDENSKDYRLETFEEIIKEGRKFGVFVTIASQRPQDISQTIASQAHNYFIHRLVNEQDLRAITNSVSYIDKLTYESIPTLPTGTCIFSGTASRRPIVVNVRELAEELQPKSQTRTFSALVK